MSDEPILFSGLERLFIEQIRVNPVFVVVGIHGTQAEIISMVMIVFGIFGLGLLSKRRIEQK
jgi:phosphatidylglycerol:prolipoprotein diacylglycerol transferase